jgi:ADP-ribose pyrophosphatase YjhB (NUDIX family)
MNENIRVRACVALVNDSRILLVPHYDTDVGPVQWLIPGGSIRFGESLRQAALRELEEETGLQACITGLLDVSEVILTEKPWHSVTIVFSGELSGGRLATEKGHRYGEKDPRGFSADEIRQIKYHPTRAVELALGILAG